MKKDVSSDDLRELRTLGPKSNRITSIKQKFEETFGGPPHSSHPPPAE